MRKARILIVDDSTAIRRLLTDALVADPAVEVVGTAANGKIALDKVPQLTPDLVTLDIEMPVMDGLETLKELRARYPKLPVVMFSTLTERGAVATLNALSLGASDYVTKPSNVGSVSAGLQSIRSELLPKIKALCSWMTDPPASKFQFRASRPASTCAIHPRLTTNVSVIAIGVSTGGPNALAEVFRDLPADIPVPIVIVQHMPSLFTKYLADRLNNGSKLEVREAASGETLRPGVAWLAPGDFHLSLVRHGGSVRTMLHQAPPENSCRPAVDVLFRAAASAYGAGVLGIVLTGMGQDGMLGAEEIRNAGGRILAQDDATSVVWGMPGAVVRAGIADEVLPLNRVAERIAQLSEARPINSSLCGATR